MLRPSACRLAARLCLRTQGALSAGRREAGGQEVWVRLSPLPAAARRLPACPSGLIPSCACSSGFQRPGPHSIRPPILWFYRQAVCSFPGSDQGEVFRQ